MQHFGKSTEAEGKEATVKLEVATWTHGFASSGGKPPKATGAVGRPGVFRLAEQRNQVSPRRCKPQINMVLFSMNWLTQAEALQLRVT